MGKLVKAHGDKFCARQNCGKLIENHEICVTQHASGKNHWYHVKCFTYPDGSPIFNVTVKADVVAKTNDPMMDHPLPRWSSDFIKAHDPRRLPTGNKSKNREQI